MTFFPVWGVKSLSCTSTTPFTTHLVFQARGISPLEMLSVPFSLITGKLMLQGSPGLFFLQLFCPLPTTAAKPITMQLVIILIWGCTLHFYPICKQGISTIVNLHRRSTSIINGTCSSLRPKHQTCENSLVQQSPTHLVDSRHDSKNSCVAHDSSLDVLFGQPDCHFVPLKRERT